MKYITGAALATLLISVGTLLYYHGDDAHVLWLLVAMIAAIISFCGLIAENT